MFAVSSAGSTTRLPGENSWFSSLRDVVQKVINCVVSFFDQLFSHKNPAAKALPTPPPQNGALLETFDRIPTPPAESKEIPPPPPAISVRKTRDLTTLGWVAHYLSFGYYPSYS